MQPTQEAPRLHATDPRHGTNAGYKAGCRQPCCRDAAARYERGREWDTYNGRRRTYPSIGFRRRVEALRALGWSMNHIAEELGMDVRNIPRTCRAITVYAEQHHRMTELFERLSMTTPTDRFANRRRALAKAKGFAPPLAWDNIDDPHEEPKHTVWGRRSTLEDYRWITGSGWSHEHALNRLGITDSAIERALQRESEVA